MSGRRWQSPRQRHFMRAASSALHLADVRLAFPTRRRGAEVKSKDYKVCNLDVSLWGGFTKILGVSRTGVFESGLSPGPSVYNRAVCFRRWWCIASLL